MKDKKEFLLCVGIFLVLVGILNISVTKYLNSHIYMNDDNFIQVGMMEYVNPTDHKVLYIPIYTKR